MRYAKIDKCEYVNGEGVGVSLYVQGCHFHCKGCFNPQTWDFEGGKEFDGAAFNELMCALRDPQIKRLTILGGEPLAPEHRLSVMKLIAAVKTVHPDLKIWIYSGYEWGELDVMTQNNLRHFTNVGIFGPFIEEQKDLTLPFMGSRNQYRMDFTHEGEN